MAKRNSMSKARAGRKLSQGRSAGRCRGAIETERSRLMKAEAVLGSVAFALKHAEWRCEDGTDYAIAVEVARDIVQESITRLDPVSLDGSSAERPDAQAPTHYPAQ
jgi:hypothetical protein